MNDTPRPWCRLHWGTLLVVALMALGWTQYALPEMVESLRDRGMRSAEGWPLRTVGRDFFAPFEPLIVDTFAFAANVATAFACLVSVGVVVERLERSRCRFRLSTALIVITVIAALLAFWRWDGAQVSQYVAYRSLIGSKESVRKYVMLRTTEVQSQVIILCGLGCFIYVSCSCALAVASRSLARLRRLAANKAEPS